MSKTKVAIIGSGNIGTDLMIKVLRLSDSPGDGRDGRHRPGLRRPGPGRAGSACPTTAEGVDGLIAHGRVRRDRASSSTPPRPGAHAANAAKLAPYGKRLIDLTPAAIGPVRRPGGQPRRAPRRAATSTWSPAAARPRSRSSPRSSRVTPVPYAEIVASIASKSAGPGTRANIDEFTETTAHAIESVGGAERGKAIIILNPAEPPLIMRDTVLLPGRRRPTTTRSAPSVERDGRRRSRRTCPATGSSRRCRSTPVARRRAGAHPLDRTDRAR